jgi:hypothetical protein
MGERNELQHLAEEKGFIDMDEKEQRVAEIERAICVDALKSAMAQSQYEHNVLTGKLPMPAPQPFRIPFTIRKADGK